jgi:hypothetical protein
MEFPVEIVYQARAGQAERMSFCGKFEHVLPTVEEGVPVLRLTARLYLPDKFKYTHFGRDMRVIAQRPSGVNYWLWGKSLLFAPARDVGADRDILREIEALCALQSSGADLITVKLTREGLRFVLARQGAGARLSVTYFGESFFYTLDIVILLAAVAALMAFARFAPVTKPAAGVFAVALFLMLATGAAGAPREFLNSAFAGSLLVSLIWLAMHAVKLRREARAARDLPLQPPVPVQQQGEPEAPKGGGHHE